MTRLTMRIPVIFKIGKRVERLDLYARLCRSREEIQREVKRLTGRIDRTDLVYDHQNLLALKALSVQPELNYRDIIGTVDALVKC